MHMLTLLTITAQSDAPHFHPRPCDLRITCTYHLDDLQQPTTRSHIRCLPLPSSPASPSLWTSWISNRGNLLTWRWPLSTILGHPLLLHQAERKDRPLTELVTRRLAKDSRERKAR